MVTRIASGMDPCSSCFTSRLQGKRRYTVNVNMQPKWNTVLATHGRAKNNKSGIQPQDECMGSDGIKAHAMVQFNKNKEIWI
jgi:hypothetical protein